MSGDSGQSKESSPGVDVDDSWVNLGEKPQEKVNELA